MDIDILDNAVNECKNPYQRTILRKGIDIKSSTYIIFEIESNNRDWKLKVSNHIRISNYKNFFVKDYAPSWSDQIIKTK